MPTIAVIDGFGLVINTRDEHEPRHVHVWKSGTVAVVNLGDDKDEHPSLHETKYGMTKKDARRALDLVEQNKGLLWKHWDRIWRQTHGETNKR